MQDRKTLMMQDENGVQLEVEILTILQIDGIEYAVYSIDKDNTTSDVYAGRLVKDQNGQEGIFGIDNVEEKKRVFGIIDRMIRES